MKSILIPTDFSENAGDALAYALNFIGKSKAKIHIINIINPNMIPVEAPEMTVNLLGPLLSDAKERMQALEAFSKSNLKDNPLTVISTSVETGSVSEVIKNKAKEKKCDVIIMGTMGQSHNILDRILGTISTSTIRNAPCPVILVPSGYKFKPITDIVFASALNAGDPFELWRASELLKHHDATIRFIYVNSKNRNLKDIEQFSSYLQSQSMNLPTEFETIKSDEVEKSILTYIEKHNAALLIMHKLNNSLWANITNQSHTNKILFKVNCPMMVMNEISNE